MNSKLPVKVGDIITFRVIGSLEGRKIGIVLGIEKALTTGNFSDWDVIHVLESETGLVKDIMGSQLRESINEIW